MGGSSTKHNRDQIVSTKNKSNYSESDESFQIIADKFGYYDSSDSEISELQFPVRSKPSHKTDYDRSVTQSDEELKGEGKYTLNETGSITEAPTSLYDTAADSDTKSKSKITEASSDAETDRKSLKTESCECVGFKSKSGASKPLQMNKQSCIDRHPTRYSREPPERDQNYEDNLKDSPCHCRNPECKRPQDYTQCCQCPNNRNINYQSQFCTERRPRTTYDLAKSAENLRQSDVKLGNYSNPKRGTHSSPEVSKNRLPIKSNEMTNNDNGVFMYNDYMLTRPTTKNDCYPANQDHLKARYPTKYPYEEPLHEDEYHNDSHERNCSCDVCARRFPRRDHYRNCKCYECLRMKRPMDDQLSSYSEESQGLNLAYQKTEEYPVLVDEIENTISMRNKERVRKTMRQFELLSRQNKSLDKPIYDDDEDEGTSNRFSYSKRPPYNRPQNNDSHRAYCHDRSANCQSRSECLSERPTYSATPFPRNRGYVEKVARYMDPSMSDTTQKYPKFPAEYGNHAGAKWQMDPRSGEWVKVYDGYDFENNYPPLPPTPSPMYREYDTYPKTQPCHSYYNTSSHRSASPVKHNMNKPCNCRNCMGNSNHGRY
ncbi:hypothetical protein Trydic_g21888 [Trypoxylus dichotomus]